MSAIDHFGAAILAQTDTATPADLESNLHLAGGHIYHGEHAPDQLLFMRPTIDSSRYATPVRGLYFGGGGAHPGGGLTGVPGALCAQMMQ